MTDNGFYATTPKPPYYAVIFTAVSSDNQQGHDSMGLRMLELAMQQAGYLGIELAGDAKNGITVSYWKDLPSIAAWKKNVDHMAAQKAGRERWYDSYRVRIALVEREYGFTR